MNKPILPSIENLVDLYPKSAPSGICPMVAWRHALGWGIPIASVLGIVVHYIGIIVGGTLFAITGILIAILTPCVGGPLSAIVVLVVIFGYPMITGRINGALTGTFATHRKCRNPRDAGLMGLITGLVMYGSYQAFCYIRTQEFTISSKWLAVSGEMDLGLGENTPWFVMLLIVLELIVWLVSSYISAAAEVTHNTYCETHDTWYGPWADSRLPFDMAETLIKAIETQNVDNIDNISVISEQSSPQLVIKHRICPMHHNCGVEMVAEVIWQEAYISRGRTRYREQQDDWFTIMLPSDLGMELAGKVLANREGALLR